MDKVSLDDLYLELEEKIKNEIGSNGKKLPKFNPFKVNLNNDMEEGALIRSELLENINKGYLYPTLCDFNQVTTPKKGLIGKVIILVKKRIYKFVVGILSNYLKAEKQHELNIVRFLNETVKYIDKRDSDVFFNLIRKIDQDVISLNRRIEEAFDEEHMSSNKEEYKNKIEILNSKVDELNSIVSGLEGIISRLNISKESFLDSKQEIPVTPKNYEYLLFENRYRGKEEDIKKKMSDYVKLIKENTKNLKNVIEVGPGRGELLSLLKENNIDAVGVELDDAMCEVLKEKNLNFIKNDAISYLKNLENASVSSIIAIQVVEHLSVDDLKIFINESKRVLQGGGSFIVETVNPVSLVALSSNFFRDPTHKMPLNPDTLSYMVKLSGLSVKSILPLSPFPNICKLQQISETEFMNPAIIKFTKKYNENIEQLNSLLYGFQDYAIVACKG